MRPRSTSKLGRAAAAAAGAALLTFSLVARPEDPAPPQDSLPAGAVARLGSRQMRQLGSIQSLLFIAGGTRLLSAGSDESVRSWDPKAGREVGRFAIHGEGVDQLLAGPNEETIFAASLDGKVTRVRRGKLSEPEVLTTGGIQAVVSPKLDRICSLNADGITFDLRDGDGNLIRTISGLGVKAGESRGSKGLKAVFSDDGTRLALSSLIVPEGETKANKVAVLRVVKVDPGTEDEEVKLLTLPGNVFFRHLVFLPGNEVLIGAAVDGSLRRIDLATGVVDPTALACKSGVYGLALSPDRTRIAAGGGDGQVGIFEVDGLRLIQSVGGHRSPVGALAFSPDGKWIASGTFDAALRVHDIESGQLVAGPTGHESAISSVAASPDGSQLATACQDGSLHLWEAATQREIGVIKANAGRVNRVTYSPTENLIAVAGQDGTVAILDSNTRELVKQLVGAEAAAMDVAFSADGKTLAMAYADDKVRLIDVGEWKNPRTLDFETPGTPFSVAVSPDGKQIAAGASQIRLWDGEGHVVLDITSCKAPVNVLVFSPDGSTLYAALADGSVRAYDVAPNADGGMQGKERFKVQASVGRVEDLAISPDGSRLATGGDAEPAARVWDAADGSLVKELVGHEEPVGAVTFLGNDRVLTGSSDLTALVWSLSK